MWTRRKRQRSPAQGLISDRKPQQQQQQRGDSSWEGASGESISAGGSSESQEPAGDAVSDAELAELLSKRRVRCAVIFNE